jgi:hypothetical protein
MHFGADAIMANTGTNFGIVSQGSGSSIVQWIDDISDSTAIAGIAVNSMYSSTGSVQIYTGDTGPTPQHTWTFGTDGSVTFPSGAGFVKGDSGQLKVNDSATVSLDLRDTSGRGFYTNSDGFSLRGNGSNTWKFGTDGSLTFPDTTVQTTAYTGAVSTSTLVNSTATVSLSSTGALTLPDGGTLRMSTAPTSSTGAAGDKAGTIAVNSASIFYCIADYYLDTGTYSAPTTNSNPGNVFFIEIAKGNYPEPQIGWGVSINGAVTQIDTATTDLGSSWRISVGSTTAYSPGTSVTLTNPSPSQPNIWVKQAWGTTGSW